MSLLLDALNKADKEKQTAVPNVHTQHAPVIEPNNSKLFLLLAVATIIVALIAGWAIYTKLHCTTPAQTTPNDSAQIAKKQTEAKIINTTNSPSQEGSAKPQNSQDKASTPPTQENSNAEGENNEGEIATLYEQNAANVQAPNTSTVTSLNTQATNAPDKLANYANLPDLHDLPPEFINKIPSLNYSEHHYSATGSSIVINGQVKHAQDTLAAGVVIEKIVEDGIILHGDVYTFKMKALNSWVNM